MRGVAAVVVMATAFSAVAQEPAWKKDLEQRRNALVAKNGSGTDAALREELLEMKQTDQNARRIDYGQTNKERPDGSLTEVDDRLTARLKEIVAKDGWPTIKLVGLEASNAAMLVLTHTHDHAWQLSLLPRLEQLADAGEIDGSSLAFVIDRELVNEGQLQRYGTQFKTVVGDNGVEMAMYGVEDPAGLDARRAKIFLPPMDAYKQQLEAMYHLKAGKQVVMATPAAPAK